MTKLSYKILRLTLSVKVTRIEDFYQKNISSGGPSDAARRGLNDSFPRRPGYGTRGQKVMLRINYFELLSTLNLVKTYSDRKTAVEVRFYRVIKDEAALLVLRILD